MNFDHTAELRKLEISDSATQGAAIDDDFEVEDPFPYNGACRQPNHTVLYEHPEISLLLPGTSLTLLPPTSTAFRPRPGGSDLGINFDETDFFTISPIGQTIGQKLAPVHVGNSQPESTDKEMARKLISDMERLPLQAGRKFLSLVTFALDHDFYFRLRRKTTFMNGAEEQARYIFSSNGWKLLAQPLGFAGGKRIWLSMLDSLYLRASDLACFHVHNRLIAQGMEDYAESEASEINWGRRAHWDAIDILLHRLVYMFKEETGQKKKVRLSRKVVAGLPEDVPITLPCKHRLNVKSESLLAVSEECCQLFQCHDCGDDVLTGLDRIDLQLVHDCAFPNKIGEIDWQVLDFEIMDTTPRTVLAQYISTSLKLARSSIGAPSSMIPMALDPE